MFYKMFILICPGIICSLHGMEIDNANKRPEYFKNLIETHLPGFQPVIGKNNILYFAETHEDANLKNIQNPGYDYRLYKSFISHKFFANVKPNGDTDKRDAIDKNSFIAALFANNYEIYLTPKDDLNSTFFLFLISLMKENKLVFKDLQWGDVHVNDIIFNVKMSFATDLNSRSEKPRFTIMINNFFDQNTDKTLQKITLNDNYKRTKIYTEKLLIFLIKKIHNEKQIPKIIAGSKVKPPFSYSITDWMWVKQASNIFDKDRKLYANTKSFAFLKPDITGKMENYAINRTPIINQALIILDEEKNALAIKNLNWYQNFVVWRSLVNEFLPEYMPYQKKDRMFFNKPKILKSIEFKKVIYYEESNKPFNGLFSYVGTKDRQFNENNLLPEDKNCIYSVFTNCYQVYLMPEQSHKEAILRVLIECVQKNEFVYRENDQNIHFRDIIFNISVSLDTVRDATSPTFVLYISNITHHSNSIKNMQDIVQKQNVYRTKKHTEQLILFLHEKFKQAGCLTFSGQIPKASVQIKNLFFVSQGLHSYFLERKNTIFDATQNFAYFLPGVTGKEENYIIDPERLFNKEEPEPLSQHVQGSLNQSDWGQMFRRLYNNNKSSADRQSNSNSFSSIWTLGQWLFDWIKYLFKLPWY